MQLADIVSGVFGQLSKASQNMFLDCVSVLEGQPLIRAMLAWEACWSREAAAAFERLKQVSFVSTSNDDERLVVHDVMRSLGRSMLIEKPVYAGSRIWLNENAELVGAVQVRHTGLAVPPNGALICNAQCPIISVAENVVC